MGITDPFNTQDAQNCAYTHDDLGRIATDTCAGGAGWTQNFSYDAFGNITKSQSGAFAPNYTQNPPTNQITTVGGTAAHYDANGNVLSDTVQNYTWDADGHPVTIGNVNQTSVGAAYDALGDVVEQNRSGSYTQVVYAPDGTKLALMNGTGMLVKAFVPLTGGATAVYTPGVTTGPTYYRHSDWLGSSRLTSTPSRTVYSDMAYAPFGETYALSGTADPSFTGMNQDTLSGVYDFPAREYEVQGRWPSPDPLGVGAVDPTDPQTWNRYAYARNSPLSMIDPTGLDECLAVSNSVLRGLQMEDCMVIDAFCILAGAGSCTRWVAGDIPDVAGCRWDFYSPQGWICTPPPQPNPGNPGDCPASERSCPGGGPTGGGGGSGGGGGGAPTLVEALKNPECAALFGGLGQANAIAAKMAGPFDVSPGSNFIPHSPGEMREQVLINSQASMSGSIISSATPGGPWNGRSWEMLVGSLYQSQAPAAQLTIVLHEMLHVAHEDWRSFLDSALSIPSASFISRRCNTEVPNNPNFEETFPIDQGAVGTLQ